MKTALTCLLAVCSLLAFGQNGPQKRFVFFALGKSTVNHQEKERLKAWTDSIGKGNLKRLVLTGHADSIGTVEANLKYSKLRAERVKTALMELGLPDSILEVRFLGESQPPFPYNASTDPTMNRCVEIALTTTFPQRAMVVNRIDKRKNRTSEKAKQEERDTALVFAQGTIIEVDAGTFSPIKLKDIEFQVTEIFTLCDMLRNNTPTKARNGDCLVSAGMLYVKAMYAGTEIHPNKGKFVKIKVPASGKGVDRDMKLYMSVKNKKGEIEWEKMKSELSYEQNGSMYYLFKTDTFFGVNLDKPIGVRCEKTGPIVKVPKFEELIITQTYPGMNYLALAEKRRKKKFVLDELKYDGEPYLTVMAEDKLGMHYVAEGKMKDLPVRRKGKKYVIKKRYFKLLTPDYTGNTSLADRMCQQLDEEQQLIGFRR